MYTKDTSRIETLRLPISRLLGFTIAGLALFTIPRESTMTPTSMMGIIGYGLLIIAALGRVWCGIYIAGRKDKSLCTEGPYSVCRNPLYLFSFLGILGFSLALKSLFIVAVCCSGFLILYHFIIASEESRLKHLFGSEYLNYIDSVPRFIPAFKQPTQLESLSINPRVLEKSLKEVVWFLFAILGIELLEMVHHTNNLLVLAHTPF